MLRHNKLTDSNELNTNKMAGTKTN